MLELETPSEVAFQDLEELDRNRNAIANRVKVILQIVTSMS